MRPLIVVLLLNAGCSADTRPSAPYAVPATREPTGEPTEQPIEEPRQEPEARVGPTVVAQGFTADPELDAASYAVVIENPNATPVPRFVSVIITFLDADGTVLTTETQNVTGIFSESTTAVAGEASEAGGATAMEVAVSSLNVLPSRIRSSLDETDRSGGITTTGAVLSGFECEQINVPIHVVYYDSAGQVVGGAAAFVEQVPPGGEVAFETNTPVVVPEIAETRVFGHIGFGD
jgi:hypothetical protein